MSTVSIHRTLPHAPVDKEGCRAKIYRRPHLETFLRTASAHFEVVLFTAAGQRHADAVLAHIDPDGVYFHHRLYQQHTVQAPLWSWVKDLSKLGRDLSKTLIVVRNYACTAA